MECEVLMPQYCIASELTSYVVFVQMLWETELRSQVVHLVHRYLLAGKDWSFGASICGKVVSVCWLYC